MAEHLDHADRVARIVGGVYQGYPMAELAAHLGASLEDCREAFALVEMDAEMSRARNVASLREYAELVGRFLADHPSFGC
jgi:hypothetical protein